MAPSALRRVNTHAADASVLDKIARVNGTALLLSLAYSDRQETLRVCSGLESFVGSTCSCKF